MYVCWSHLTSVVYCNISLRDFSSFVPTFIFPPVYLFSWLYCCLILSLTSQPCRFYMLGILFLTIHSKCYLVYFLSWTRVKILVTEVSFVSLGSCFIIICVRDRNLKQSLLPALDSCGIHCVIYIASYIALYIMNSKLFSYSWKFLAEYTRERLAMLQSKNLFIYYWKQCWTSVIYKEHSVDLGCDRCTR